MASAANVSILEIFKSKLNAGLEVLPICHLHNFPCHCEDQFIRTASLYRWMEHKEDDESKTNVERLLEEVNAIPVLFPDSILKGEKRCVLVFSILLKQDRGNLIYIFQSAGIIDEHLGVSHYKLSGLEEKLKDKKISDFDTIINRFERQKWEYCPARLELDMNKTFEDRLRLPFCERKKVNNKGGETIDFQVIVQEEFLSDKFKKSLGIPFKTQKFGPVSTTDLIFFIEDVN